MDSCISIDSFFNSLITKMHFSNGLSNNLFSILGIVNLETKHSNFLAYLFDEKQNLGVGRSILNLFLRSCKIENFLKPYSIEDILNDNVNIEVSRENNNIDIVINVVGFVTILIENKIWADEHNNQLFRYKSVVCDRLNNPKDELYINKIKTPICIYLTPNGRDARIDNDWLAIGYTNILQILKNFKKSRLFYSLSEKQKIMIIDYLEVLEKVIVKENKKETQQILNEFFLDIEKKKIMDIIVECVPNYKERARRIKDCMKLNNIEILNNSLFTTSYINFIPSSFKSVFEKMGLKNGLFYFQLSNNSSFKNSTVSTYFNFEAKEQKTIFLAEKFFEFINCNKKLSKDTSKDRSLGYSLIFLTEQQEYSLCESDKQSIIVNFFKNFETNEKVKLLYEKLLKFEELSMNEFK